MQTRSASKSSLLLIELILVVLFFAITSAVCMGLFVRSHILAANNRDLNRAAILLQSTAEQIKAAPLPVGVYLTYFDENWQTVQGTQDADYLRTVEVTPDGRLPLLTNRLWVRRLRDDKEIFALTTSQYQTKGNLEDE